MSKADEMFEELGYEDSPVGYGAKRYKGTNYFITFYKKEVHIYPREREMQDDVILNIRELQAINEKVKELGWIKNE